MPRTNNDLHFGCSATIECSYQPLDISFHPVVSTIVAAALVDGTVEVHDYSELVAPPTVASLPKVHSDYDIDEAEENDTIVSSTKVHSAPLTTTYRAAVNEQQSPPPQHSSSSSCRAVQFSNDGATLWTGGSDGHIVALDTEQICTFSSSAASSSLQKNDSTLFQYRITNAGYHTKGATTPAPIQVLYEIPERHLLASGDDIGCVRLWDRRLLDIHTTTNDHNNHNHQQFPTTTNNNPRSALRGCVADWKVHDDYVSAIQHSPLSLEDITFIDGKSTSNIHTLLSTSADGTLVIYDLRMTSTSSTSSGSNSSNNNNFNSSTNQQQAKALPYGVIRQSDPQDDELLSLCIMKHGKKVVCGTTEGVLSIFSYGTWGDVSDRYPGHPSSIDAILKIDEDTILTGSSDGLIRVVSIQPNQFIGIIGDNHEGFPIEQLQLTCDRSYVGSVTHDNYIRLWNARILDETYDDENDDDDNNVDIDDDDDVKMSAIPIKSDNFNKDSNSNSDDEWEDMDEDDNNNTEEDDDDDDDDDDMDSDDGKKKKNKASSTKNGQRASRLKSDRERFFDDL